MLDPGTEHLIMQLHHAMRSVCDLARASAFHSTNAKDAFSQLRAMQTLNQHLGGGGGAGAGGASNGYYHAHAHQHQQHQHQHQHQ